MEEDKKATDQQEEKPTSSPSLDMKIGAGLFGGFAVTSVRYLFTHKGEDLILALLLYLFGFFVYLFAIADADNGETLGFVKRIKNGWQQLTELSQLVKAPLVVGAITLVLMGLIYSGKYLFNLS